MVNHSSHPRVSGKKVNMKRFTLFYFDNCSSRFLRVACSMQQPSSKTRCLSLEELWIITSGLGRCTGSSWQHSQGTNINSLVFLPIVHIEKELFNSFLRCTIQEDFGKMLESGQFCDVNFLLGEPGNEVIVQAHASIIAARCLYLQSKLRV